MRGKHVRTGSRSGYDDKVTEPSILYNDQGAQPQQVNHYEAAETFSHERFKNQCAIGTQGRDLFKRSSGGRAHVQSIDGSVMSTASLGGSEGHRLVQVDSKSRSNERGDALCEVQLKAQRPAFQFNPPTVTSI